MDVNELIMLIKEGENERIEFKTKATKDIAREICGLANANGGHDVDRKILELLVIPRRSGEIPEAIDLSKPAVVERLKKLESLGLIRKTGKGAHVKYFIPSPP